MSVLPSSVVASLDDILLRHRHQATELLQILIQAQQIEGWLPAADLAVNLALDGAGRLLTVTALTPRGTACLSTLTPPAAA